MQVLTWVKRCCLKPREDCGEMTIVRQAGALIWIKAAFGRSANAGAN